MIEKKVEKEGEKSGGGGPMLINLWVGVGGKDEKENLKLGKKVFEKVNKGGGKRGDR